MGYLPEGNDITERLDLIQGITPFSEWKMRNNVVPLETRVQEELSGIQGFRERIGELPSDDQTYKKMVGLYLSLPKELQTLGGKE